MKPATDAEVAEIENQIKTYDEQWRVWRQSAGDERYRPSGTPSFSITDVAALVARIRQLEKLVKAVQFFEYGVELLDVDGKSWHEVAEPYRKCDHKRTNDDGNECLDCGAELIFQQGWQGGRF